MNNALDFYKLPVIGACHQLTQAPPWWCKGQLTLAGDMEFNHGDDRCVISRCAYAGHVDQSARVKGKHGPPWSQNTYATGSITGEEGAHLRISIRIVIRNNRVQMDRVLPFCLAWWQAVGRSGRRQGR